MYIILAYRKETNYSIIDECIGPFNDHYGAACHAQERWGIDGVDEEGRRTEGKYNIVIRFMECPL